MSFVSFDVACVVECEDYIDNRGWRSSSIPLHLLVKGSQCEMMKSTRPLCSRAQHCRDRVGKFFQLSFGYGEGCRWSDK